MSFKTFLNEQDDNIEQEDAVKRYSEYKNDFKKTQIAEFFAAHKDEDWFVSIERKSSLDDQMIRISNCCSSSEKEKKENFMRLLRSNV